MQIPEPTPNRAISLPPGSARITVHDALARLEQARGEAVFDVYANSDDLEHEGTDFRVAIRGGCVPSGDELKAEFLAFVRAGHCAPSMPLRRWQQSDYDGTDQQDWHYDISIAEFQRFAAGYAVEVLTIEYTEAVEVEAPKAVTRSEAHEQAIVAKLRGLGYDPMALPPYVPGRDSLAKQAVEKELKNMSAAVFKAAWGRLLKGGAIKYG